MCSSDLSLLANLRGPWDLKGLTLRQLDQLASEIREAICRLASTRTAHFASNLGVVELTLALHASFDFRTDRLVWDTGHQVYAHKMLTGRYDEFQTLRAKGGLMGYPNPAESEFDLFMTGHAGSSVSTALGLRCGDGLLDPDRPRHVVAVVGDGAFPCGLVFEAMNHAGGLKKRLIVVLNDNKMSICPRVGGLAESLDRLRMNPFYTGLKTEVQKLLARVPLLGDPVERFLSQVKDAVKAGLVGGMFFEDLGFRYVGPVDGHNIAQLKKYFAMVQQLEEPVLLHVVTEKGHGYAPAVLDPTDAEKTRFRKRQLSSPRPRRTKQPSADGSTIDPELREIWAALPRNIHFLSNFFDDSVTANYYRGEFKESRTELIRRLLDPELTLEEVSRLLGVCPATVRRYTNRGWLDHVRTKGGQRRFRLSHIVAFVDRHGRMPEA